MSYHDWDASTVEGGDVLVLGAGAVAIGVGERTTAQGVEGLSGRLHLDQVITMVRPDTFPPTPPFDALASAVGAMRVEILMTGTTCPIVRDAV